MTDIDFSFEWQTTGNDAPEIKNTMAQRKRSPPPVAKPIDCPTMAAFLDTF